VRKVVGDLETRAREELYININPIQAAGRLTPEAMRAVIAYGDGYSTCDACRKPFRLDKIQKPAIHDFHVELAEFLGMDEARVVPGARRGFQAVVSSLVEKGDTVLVSALAHYTEFLAVEEDGKGHLSRDLILNFPSLSPDNLENLKGLPSLAHSPPLPAITRAASISSFRFILKKIVSGSPNSRISSSSM